MGYDVIIVGAGEGGLFTGAILAKQGLKTLILEKNPLIGGRAMCFEYKPGYIVDWGIHSIRYGKRGIIPTIFRKELGIKLKLLDYGKGRLYRKSEWIAMPTGIKEFMTTPLLTGEERESFIPLFLDIIKLKVEDYLDVNIQDYFKDKVQSENLWDLIRLIAAALMVTPEIELASMGELIYGIKEVATAGKGAVYPEGGWKSIFDALSEIISENGEIRTKTSVKEILISDKKVKGVLLEDGTEIFSDLVVAAIPSQKIFSILSESEFSPSFISLCKNLICSSGISIDYGLKEKISDDSGLLAVDVPMSLGAYTSNIDPSTAPENEQLFTFLQPVPKETAENTQQAKQILERIEKLVAQMYPGIKQKIKWKRPLIIPVMDGAVNYVGQTRDKRPSVKSNVITGLFFSGDTYNGPGLGGDIAPSSARLCAHTILNDLKERESIADTPKAQLK
ncbi:MAG: NAD(P)/FAD-dependent oxidoreductase [Candidatus Helarchaeota archaeon]|nr:NAD(P)/FAD-dependent oxidoreductase [Candidatus Helarchaeota archaeon]